MQKADEFLARLAGFADRNPDYQIWICTSMGVAAFLDAIRKGEPDPIPYDEIIEVSRVAIELAGHQGHERREPLALAKERQHAA